MLQKITSHLAFARAFLLTVLVGASVAGATRKACAQNLIQGGSFDVTVPYPFSSQYPNNQASVRNEGVFAIANNPKSVHTGGASYFDHSVGTGVGKMMVVNGSPAVPPLEVWSQSVNVQPSTTYQFSMWVSSWSLGSVPSAMLRVQVNGGTILLDSPPAPPVTTWKLLTAAWSSGSATTATITITDESTVIVGNDFALDDISFTPQLSQSCCGWTSAGVNLYTMIAGNVGIGVALPNWKLTVNGYIKILQGGIEFPDGSQQLTAQLQGKKGDKGDKGDTGPEGPPGKDGIDGATGKQGIQGVPGNDGMDGATGEQGIQGVPGPTKYSTALNFFYDGRKSLAGVAGASNLHMLCGGLSGGTGGSIISTSGLRIVPTSLGVTGKLKRITITAPRRVAGAGQEIRVSVYKNATLQYQTSAINSSTSNYLEANDGFQFGGISYTSLDRIQVAVSFATEIFDPLIPSTYNVSLEFDID